MQKTIMPEDPDKALQLLAAHEERAVLLAQEAAKHDSNTASEARRYARERARIEAVFRTRTQGLT